jgi:hypothetical protein
MLLSNAINALAPWATDPPPGAAWLSSCNAKQRNAAVKIDIHLTLNGNRCVDALGRRTMHSPDYKEGSFCLFFSAVLVSSG